MKHRHDTAFGQRLRIVQRALDMSEKQMADAIGVTVKTLRGWQRLRLSVCSSGSDTCTSRMSSQECDNFLDARGSCQKGGWWPYDIYPQPKFYNPYR